MYIILAYIIDSILVEFIKKVDPLQRLEMETILNNIRSS